MAAPGLALLAEGEAALARGDWASARSLFADALARGDSPDACFGLARAAEWAGDFGTAVSMYEHAFAGLRARGETRLPALIAGRELAFLYAAVYGNMAAADGWLTRARSLAEDAGDCVERGWVELAEALATEDPEAVETHARAATAIAGRFGDADLHFCALGYRGTALVLRGRVAEGMRRLDEAAVAARSGEVRDHLVVGEIYCKVLRCSELALDVRRAQDWMTVADAAGRSDDLWVSAICRMHYGGVLIAAGRWAEADDMLASSLRLYDAGMRAMRSGAAVRLADLRVRQGRLGEAAVLLAGNEFDDLAVLPLARLHLVRGEAELAAALLRRSLGGTGPSVPHAPAWGLLGELEALGGRPADARTTGDGLAALALDTGLPHVRAHAELVAGVACWSAGEPGALPHLEAALAAFASAGLPWEGARTRLLIAEVLGRSNREVAVAEARAAVRTFRQLGAAPDADGAAAVLRDLGAPEGRGPREAGPLTGRENEVLRLVAEGLSNQEIAGRLFLSKRTVEHHVGSILAKLGVSTRAEAQASVLRSGSS